MCSVASNNKIKETIKLHQKKYRDSLGLFIAEGIKSIEEIISSGLQIQEIFIKNGYKYNFNKYTVYSVDENIMKKLTTTDSPCEIMAVVKKPKTDINDVLNGKHIILLDSISDPGNLGTIIRSAAAFNIDAIILYGNCVELYSPKVIRSAVGNLFKTPIIEIKNETELKEIFKDYTKIATALSKENNISIKECSKLNKYIVMFGSEAKGLSKELINISEKNIKLDMAKDVESLNLSVTASIIMYELFS